MPRKAPSIASYASDPKLGRRFNPLSISVPSGAGGFNPLSISGLVAWYDFSAPTTLFTDTGRTTAVSADAQTIKGVTDKGSTGAHLSEATNGPTYKVAIQNGRSVARFDGSNDILTSAAITVAQPMTILIAGALASTAGATRRFTDANTGRCIIGSSNVGPVWNLFAGSSQNTATTSDTSWHAHDVVINGAASNWRLDGTSIGTMNAGANSLSTTIFLGRDNAAQFDALDYGELLIYDSALSAGNRAALDTYLKSRWGTP